MKSSCYNNGDTVLRVTSKLVAGRLCDSLPFCRLGAF